LLQKLQLAHEKLLLHPEEQLLTLQPVAHEEP
jgi:hypothetical protein